MHELPATRSVLDIVLRHAAKARATEVRRVFLEIDGPSDLDPKWLGKYWTRVAADTVAAGSVLDVTVRPAQVVCDGCGARFELERRKPWRGQRIRCPECSGEDCRLVPSRGWTVTNMEVV